MHNYKTAFFSKAQTTYFNDVFEKISEEIRLNHIDQALEFLSYVEKTLEQISATGAINLNYSIFVMHTSAYCYSL